jgi:hypothetical protein
MNTYKKGGRGWVRGISFAFALSAASGFAQNAPGVGSSSATALGQVVSSVTCAADSRQTYALYLPSAYTPQRPWPIVYVFDPGGRGANPLSLMKDAAEKYGYILAASNNAHNGQLKPQAEAAQAVWQDTHERLAIDDKQIAFAGHSGGARLAAWVSQQCKCAQVFATVGMLDFNYGEMVQLDARLDSLRYSHFLRRWDGPHAWAPAEVWEEALAWLELSAMKQGRRSREDAFVATELERAAERAARLEQAGSPYFAWQSYRQAWQARAGMSWTIPMPAACSMALLVGRKTIPRRRKPRRCARSRACARNWPRRKIPTACEPSSERRPAWLYSPWTPATVL